MDSWANLFAFRFGYKGTWMMDHYLSIRQKDIVRLGTPCQWPPIAYAGSRRWQLDTTNVDWWD